LKHVETIKQQMVGMMGNSRGTMLLEDWDDCFCDLLNHKKHGVLWREWVCPKMGYAQK
jgi:hypothetical protein